MSEKEKPEKPRPVLKLFVGYRTKLRPGAETAVPTFKAPANYKDAAKITAFQEERKAGFMEAAKNMPYTGTFDEVYLIDPQARDEKDPEKKKFKFLRYTWHPPEEGKPPIAVRVRNYLQKWYKWAWAHETVGRRPAEVVFVGFDPRTFLKILGLECSLPEINKPCQLGMWYGNSDHRDIGEAVCPKEFGGLTLPFALSFRRPQAESEAAYWDAWVKGWTGPGENPEADARIAVELAKQLGFLTTEIE